LEAALSRLRRWLRAFLAWDRPRSPTRLDVCPECGEEFVYPVTWTESGPADWWLLLRCGACDEWRDVVASNVAVEAFDRTLDAEMAEIRATAEQLERESFSAQAESFETAMRLDLLSADDFR
jgi:hypothetical protein